jgi:hypothetical protein
MIDSLTKLFVASLLIAGSSGAFGQDVRYSWFDVSYVQQEIDEQGSFVDFGLGQTVDVAGTDGNGVKFRGSFGTWKNMFVFVDFNSSDIDVYATVTNSSVTIDVRDEFDFTSIRGGVGLRWPLTLKTDIYGTLSYDSTDFDLGSFAGESFDTGHQDVGASVGVRSMFGDKIELRASIRFTEVGNVDLTTGTFSDDTLFGVGFGYELIRGLSLTGDFESGEFSSWNIGFRVDLDED